MTARITAAGTWQATDDLFVNFANKTRGDARVLMNLVCMDRRYNNQDDNGDGQVDNLAELRLAGLININTAPPLVLRYLHYYTCPSEASWRSINGYDSWDILSGAKLPYEYFDFNQRTYDYREKIGAFAGRAGEPGFREGPAEIMKVDKMVQTDNLFDQLTFPRSIPGIYGAKGGYSDSLRNLRPELAHFYSANPTLDSNGNPAFNPWFYDQATFNDLNERMFLFDRISDLVTTRSDTFLAYIVVQRIDRDPRVDFWSKQGVRVVQQRRLVVIFDRSFCNSPPGSADYQPPRVIARSVATW